LEVWGCSGGKELEVDATGAEEADVEDTDDRDEEEDDAGEVVDSTEPSTSARGVKNPLKSCQLWLHV
jgi:hypothetical protein